MLEGGSYGIWLGSSLSNSTLVGSVRIEGDFVVEKCVNICPIREKLDVITPDIESLKTREVEWLKKAEDLPIVKISTDSVAARVIDYSNDREVDDRASRIAGELTQDQLIAMASGDLAKGQLSELGSAGQTVPGAAAETPDILARKPWNVPRMVLADGPAGLRLQKSFEVVDGIIQRGSILEALEGGFLSDDKETAGDVFYQYCTAIPVGTLLAQTWDEKLVYEIGEMVGREMELFNVALWLAPGMNIHRNPLCGRNFEYYSEDPLVSGLIAAAITKGVQSVPGRGTTIKHMACNNQEDNRMGSDSIVDERALREIYLKGFEIAVRESKPRSIMTSYNLINGVYSANNYDLCTKAARMEWGFDGVIMTDWTTTTNPASEACTAPGCMLAGNDLIMPGHIDDHIALKEALDNGSLPVEVLRHCVANTIRTAIKH